MSTVYSKSVDERIKYFFILKVYVFFEALMEPVDLTWFKLYLKKKKTNKQTNKSKRQLGVSGVGYS